MMKLPRTLHLEDSRMPSGEVDKDAVKLSALVDRFVVVEEKIDGTGVGLSFDNDANICIQTRAKIANTREFIRLHAWANENINRLWEVLSDRYIMFGEWTYAKHTCYYNNLCHYFLESDIYDRKNERWLSTYRRQELISRHGGDIICSVPILKIGRISSRDNLKEFVMPSFFKTEKWKMDLQFFCDKYHYDFGQIMHETDDSILMEGLYLKHEDKDEVIGRYKYIRHQFLDTILKSGSHYKDRTIIPNGLTQR